jgi:indole-3-glycerol phosphate synthase
MGSMLEQILEATRDRVAQLRPIGGELEEAAQEAPAARDLAGALLSVGLSVIAEVKRKSPSRGVLSTSLDPIAQASAYESGGAAAISVLTEPDFFAGSSRDLRNVKSAVSIPVIRKDFILDPLQVFEAKAIGADALLLIVAALEAPLLRELLQLTYELGIQAIVEAHNEAEIAVALEVGAPIVGVNNRNLATFEVDLGTAEGLAEMLSSADVTVGESGIHTPADAKRMSAAGYDAVLVGEALVKANNPAGLIRDFRAV